MVLIKTSTRAGPCLTETTIRFACTHEMENVFIFDDTYTHETAKQSSIKNEQQEKDRRERAIAVVTKFKDVLDLMFVSLVAKKYQSVLFRQCMYSVSM